MARVLFVNPVVREEDVPRHIPYGIALLASIARGRGHQVAVYDANAWRQPISKVSDACRADQWDVIAIGGLTTTYGFIKQACKLIKEAAPKALLVAGGGFLTSMPSEIMDFIPEIDVGVVGEAFSTFPAILDAVDQGSRDVSDMQGVIWRDPAGPVLNEARPLIRVLDDLPYPAWDLFPLEEVYFKNSSTLFSEDAHLAKRRIDINASFGCSLVCRYCWHLGTTGDMAIENNDVVFSYARDLRYHSPDYLRDLVADLKQHYQIDFVNFLDENLMTMHASSGRKWLHEICDQWDPSIHWSGTSHAGLYDRSILEHMAEKSCSHLVYGLESFDPGILKKLGKGTTRQKNIDCISATLNAGIIPIPNIIIGFPEESYDSLRNTITALIHLGIHAKPHFATAYPGSEWYYAYKQAIVEQYGGSLENYILDLGDATKITATISRNFSPSQLLGLQQIVALRDLRLLALSENHQQPQAQTSSNFRPHK